MSEMFPEAPIPEGFGGFLHAVLDDPAPDGAPYTHAWQPAPVQDAPWPDLPPESANWSWSQWQRYAGAMLIRDVEYRMDQAFFGAAVEPMSMEHAQAMYDMAQAEARAVATDELYAGSDPEVRRYCKDHRMPVRRVLPLRPSRVANDRYRQRCKNRARRRR